MENNYIINRSFIFLCTIGDILCASCYHYSYGIQYCSGYCSGFYGSQNCIYYTGSYIFSGSAIAGIVIGLIAAAAIVVVVVVVCMKNYNKRTRTIGAVNTTRTNIAVTTHTTGFVHPMNPYSIPVAPPQYSSVYPPTQHHPPAYQQEYSLTALPPYSSLYIQSNHNGPSTNP